MPYNPDLYAQQEVERGPIDAYWQDSRFNGNTPWQQGIRQYAQLGTPGLTDRPFEGMGKTDISDRLPFEPPAAGRVGMRNPTPEEMGPTSKGMFEAFGGGLTNLATELPLGAIRAVGLGSGHIDNFQNLLVNAIGGAGSLFDGVLDFVPVVPFLPGSGDIKAQYEQFDDELKVQYDELIRTNPQQAMEYMHQYLQLRGRDLAQKQGMPGTLAMFATPSMSFSEQLSKIIFGGMMASGDAVARTYVGSPLRDADGTILNRPMEELPQELQDLRQRYERGDITKDEFYDELSLGSFRWTQDTGFGGFLINTVMDIVSDPLIWASFGLGAAAKIGVNPAVRMAAMRTANLAKKAPTRMSMADQLAPKFKLSPDDFLRSEKHEHRAAMQEWARTNAPELEKQGLQSLNKRQRAAYELRDIITPAAKVANEIDSLFGFFGASHIAPRLRAVRSSNYLEGFVRAAGYKNVKLLQGLYDDFDDFNTSLGVASGNSAMVDGQRMSVDELMSSNRAADVSGQSSVIKTPEMTPTQTAQIHAEVGLKEAMATEGEQGFLRYMEDFIRGTDEASLEASRTAAIASMARALSRQTGKSVEQVTGVLNQMNNEGLALAHQVLYGKQVRTFKSAQRDLLGTLRAKRDNLMRRAPDDEATKAAIEEVKQAERYTLISENTLTDTAAKALLETIKHDTDAARAAAREAVGQYDQLNINWAKDIRDPEVQRLEMVKHLETLLEKEGALVHALDTAKLPDVVRNSLDPDGRYQIGLLPEDQWGIIRHEDGTVRSVNPFVEASDGIDVGMARKANNWDRMRTALFEPITGARIAAKARHNMRQVGAYEFGLTKAESDTFFKAIQGEAIKRNKGMRAWGADELNQIARDASVRMPAHIRNRYGERAWLEFTLRAFEGNLSMLGLTSRVSSKVKTRAGRAPVGDNLLGKIAEDMYPKLRFTLSPMFLAMELTEGPFFAILRGIKPGYRWTEQDIRLNSILRSIAPDFVEIGAGTTRALVAKGDSTVGIRVAERSRFDRGWNKIMPSRWHKPEKRIRGPRFYNVYEWKRQMYNRQVGNRMGIDFVEGLKQTEQGQKLLGQLESTYNTTNGMELWMRYAEERGMFDPDARHAVHMLDAAKPESMGRERIRIGDVARFNGYDTAADMKQAIRDDNLTRDAFIDNYTSHGLDEAYATRAWQVADGFTVDEFAVELEKAVGGKEAAESAMAFHKTMANAAKMSLEEFLNTAYRDVPEVVAHGRSVPGLALRQTVKETLEQSDMVFTKRGDAVFDDALDRARASLPDTTPELNELGEAGKTLSSKSRLAGQRVVSENAGVAPNLPPELKALGDPDPAKRVDGYVALYSDMKDVFGSMENLTTASNWYDDVLSVFVGVSGKVPVVALERLHKVWDESLEAQIAKASPNERASLEAMRKDLSGMSEQELRSELAARMHIAFGGTQQNMKVLEGMKKVAALLEEAVNEKNKDKIIDDLAEKHGMTRAEAEVKYTTRYGMDVMVARLDSMLKDFGNMPSASLGQKLTDFLDSLASNTKRTADGGALGLQPAAMDIWMMRVFGYGDSAFLDYLARQTAKRDGISYTAAEKVVADHYGWDLETVRKQEPSAPGTPAAYEWMLHRTNEMKDWMNGEMKDKNGKLLPNQNTIAGPNGKWTAAEVQAMVWVGLQKKIDYTDAAPVLGLIYDTGAGLVPAGSARRPRRLSPENTTYSQATAPEWTSVRATLPAALKDAKKVEGARFVNKPKVVVDEFDFQGQTRKRYTKYGKDNQPIGTVSFRVDENGVAMSQTVVVEPGNRRQGIASELYEMAEGDGYDMVSGARTQSPEGQAFTQAYAKGDYAGSGVLPQWQDLYAKYGDEAEAVMSSVGYHLTNSLNNAIIEELGITPLRTTHGIEGATQTVFGTYDQSLQAAARMAIAMDKPIHRVGKGSSHNTFDLVFDGKVTSQQVGPYMAALSEFIDQYLPKVTAKQLPVFENYVSMPLADGRMAHRAVTKKKAPGGAKLADGSTDPIYPVDLPPDVMAKLEDGSWVKDIPGNEDIGPEGYLPVTVERNRIAFETMTPEKGRELVGDDGVASRYSDIGTKEAERAYAEGASEAFSSSGSRAAAAGNATGSFAQRDRAGAVRAGFLAATDAERAALYFVRNSADASSAIHESFHLFVRHIDQSAKDGLVREYNRVHGLTGKSQKRRFTVDVEEWVAAEFEKFAANDPRPGASYGHIFKAFGEWAKENPDIPKGGSAIDDALDALFENWADVPAAFTDADSRRIWESTRYALLKAEEEAHSTAYYRRGNNWLMRSMNHPYLGFYPASYMWGKVLPEMTRFLLRKPFGLKAPLGGLQMFSHVYRNIQMQLDTDEEFGEWLEAHPDTVRMLSLMVPGMPQEMPVNLPVVARRAAEMQAENDLREAQGKEREPFDTAGWLSDTMSYAVGFTNLADRMGDIAGEWSNTPSEEGAEDQGLIEHFRNLANGAV